MLILAAATEELFRLLVVSLLVRRWSNALQVGLVVGLAHGAIELALAWLGQEAVPASSVLAGRALTVAGLHVPLSLLLAHTRGHRWRAVAMLTGCVAVHITWNALAARGQGSDLLWLLTLASANALAAWRVSTGRADGRTSDASSAGSAH